MTGRGVGNIPASALGGNPRPIRDEYGGYIAHSKEEALWCLRKEIAVTFPTGVEVYPSPEPGYGLSAFPTYYRDDVTGRFSPLGKSLVVQCSPEQAAAIAEQLHWVIDEDNPDFSITDAVDMSELWLRLISTSEELGVYLDDIELPITPSNLHRALKRLENMKPAEG